MRNSCVNLRQYLICYGAFKIIDCSLCFSHSPIYFLETIMRKHFLHLYVYRMIFFRKPDMRIFFNDPNINSFLYSTYLIMNFFVKTHFRKTHFQIGQYLYFSRSLSLLCVSDLRFCLFKVSLPWIEQHEDEALIHNIQMFMYPLLSFPIPYPPQNSPSFLLYFEKFWNVFFSRFVTSSPLRSNPSLLWNLL